MSERGERERDLPCFVLTPANQPACLPGRSEGDPSRTRAAPHVGLGLISSVKVYMNLKRSRPFHILYLYFLKPQAPNAFMFHEQNQNCERRFVLLNATESPNDFRFCQRRLRLLLIATSAFERTDGDRMSPDDRPLLRPFRSVASSFLPHARRLLYVFRAELRMSDDSR